MARRKITAAEMAAYLIRDGKIVKEHLHGVDSYIIVKSHGHKYWIDNPYGAKPRITQLADDSENVSKN